MAAAVDSAGAALGALGMLAFAIVFSLTAESSIVAAFIGASLAWLILSVAAWYVRRRTRSVQGVEQKGSGSSFVVTGRRADDAVPPDGSY